MIRCLSWDWELVLNASKELLPVARHSDVGRYKLKGTPGPCLKRLSSSAAKLGGGWNEQTREVEIRYGKAAEIEARHYSSAIANVSCEKLLGTGEAIHRRR
jgi:hypothetical protein